LQSSIANVTLASATRLSRLEDDPSRSQDETSNGGGDHPVIEMIFSYEGQVGRLESLPTQFGGVLGIPQIAESPVATQVRATPVPPL
jgi:hypothetical protein